MNTRKALFPALLIGSFLALPAYAGCTPPVPPSKVPDGAAASQEEMVTAMQTLKHYATDVSNYTKCLQFETSQNRLSDAEQARLHNSAVEMLQSISAKFNEQVRLFKAKSGG